MIQRHPIGNAPAAIMAGDGELVEAELSHHTDHIFRHDSLRIRQVIRSRRGATALSVAAQVSADYGEILREDRSDIPPHEMCFRKAVKEQKGRSGAGSAHKEGTFPSANDGSVKSVEHLDASDCRQGV
jgi:hypothetical protein